MNKLVFNRKRLFYGVWMFLAIVFGLLFYFSLFSKIIEAGTCTGAGDCTGWASCGGSCDGTACPGADEECVDHDGDPDTSKICVAKCVDPPSCDIRYCSGGGGGCTPCTDCACVPPDTFSWVSAGNRATISQDGDTISWTEPSSWGVDAGKGDGTCSGCDSCTNNTSYYKVYDSGNNDITCDCSNATGCPGNGKLSESHCEFTDLDGSGLRGTTQDITVVGHNGCCNLATATENTIVVSAASKTCDFTDCQATEDTGNGYVDICSKFDPNDGTKEYCKLDSEDSGIMTVFVNGSMIGSAGVDDILTYDANNLPGGFGDYTFTYTGGGLSQDDEIIVRFINDHEYPSPDRNLFIEGISVDGTAYDSAGYSELINCNLGSADCQDSTDSTHPIECENVDGDFCPNYPPPSWCAPDPTTGIACTPDDTDCQSDLDKGNGYACPHDDGSGGTEFCKYCVPDESDCQADEDTSAGYTCEDSDGDFCQEATENTCLNMNTVITTGEFCEENDGSYFLVWHNSMLKFTLPSGANHSGTAVTVNNPCPDITHLINFNDYPQCSLTSSSISASETPRFSNDNSSDPPTFSVSHLGEVDLTATASDPDGDSVMVNGWELNTPTSARFDEDIVYSYEQASARGKGWDLYDNDSRLLEAYLQGENNDVVSYRWCDFDNSTEEVSNCTAFVEGAISDGSVRYRDVAIDIYERADGTTRFFQALLHDDKQTIDYRDCPFDPTGGIVSGQTVGSADCSSATLNSISMSNLCELDADGDCTESLFDISSNNSGLGHMIYDDGTSDKIHLGTLDYSPTGSETNGAVCEFDIANGDFDVNDDGYVECDVVDGGDVGIKEGFAMSEYTIITGVGPVNRYAQTFINGTNTLEEQILRCNFVPSTNSANSCVDNGTDLIASNPLTNRFYGDKVNVAYSTGGFTPTITTTITDEHGLSNTCTMEYETTNSTPTLDSISPDDEWSGTLTDDDNHPDTNVCTDRNPQIFTVTVEDLDGVDDITRTALWVDDEDVHVSNIGNSARGTITKGVILELWASGESSPEVAISIDENSDGSFTPNEFTYSQIVTNNWSADDSNYLNYRFLYPEPISADQVEIKVTNAGTLHIEKLELNGVDVSPDTSELSGAGSSTSFDSSTVYGSNNYRLQGSVYESDEIAECGVDTGSDCWRNYGSLSSNGVDEVGTDPSDPVICSGSTLTATDDRTSCSSTDYASGFAVTEIRELDDDGDGVDERMEVDFKFWFNNEPDNLLDIGTNLDIYTLVDDQTGAREGWVDSGDWNLDFDAPTITLDSTGKTKREIAVTWSADDGTGGSDVLKSLGYGSFTPDSGTVTGGTGIHSVTTETLGDSSFDFLWDKSGSRTNEEEIIDIDGVEDAGRFEFQLESVDNACNMTDDQTDCAGGECVDLGEPWLITQGGFLYSGYGVSIPVPNLTAFDESVPNLLQYDKGEIQISTELATSTVLEKIIERTDADYDDYNPYTVTSYADANQDGTEGVYSYSELKNMAESMYTYDDTLFVKESTAGSYDLTLSSNRSISNLDLDGDSTKSCNATDKICWLEFGGLDISGDSKLTCNRKTVIFVDGDLTIEAEIDNGSGLNGCIFVVSGDIEFDYASTSSNLDYDEIDGFFIADGVINIEDDDSAIPNGLIINGGIIGYGDSSGSSVEYHKDLGLLDNIESPSLVINHDLRYTIMAGEIFKQGEDSEVYKKNEGFKPY